MKIEVHMSPQSKLTEVLSVLGEPPDDSGFTSNPGWWIIVKDDVGRVLLSSPLRSCIAGLGIDTK